MIKHKIAPTTHPRKLVSSIYTTDTALIFPFDLGSIDATPSGKYKLHCTFRNTKSKQIIFENKYRTKVKKN